VCPAGWFQFSRFKGVRQLLNWHPEDASYREADLDYLNDPEWCVGRTASFPSTTPTHLMHYALYCTSQPCLSRCQRFLSFEHSLSTLLSSPSPSCHPYRYTALTTRDITASNQRWFLCISWCIHLLISCRLSHRHSHRPIAYFSYAPASQVCSPLTAAGAWAAL